MKRAAVIVAAGKGRRMQSDLPKQYLLLKGIPVLARSCRIFSDYGVDLLVVVIPPEDETYVREEILRPYGIDGAVLVPGGKERQDSVFQGLLAAEGCDLVMIHDGARPLADREILRRTEEAALDCGAAVAAVPVKDTIKIADPEGFAAATPDRSLLWAIQTPQTFLYPEIREAHERWQREKESSSLKITDDAMMVEELLKKPVKLVMGSYRNQKITTPEDLLMMETWI